MAPSSFPIAHLPQPTKPAPLPARPPTKQQPLASVLRSSPDSRSTDAPPPRSDRSNGPAAAPSTRPALPEEMVEEILVRFPPDDPASLVRAVLVCKPWCRLVSGDGFRRRFRQFHCTPPVLGFVFNLRAGGVGHLVSRFVPTSSFRPRQTDHYGWRVLDARHGRLLHIMDWDLDLDQPNCLVVWDPVTDERWKIRPCPLPNYTSRMIATVLCADTGTCDHLDCHRGHFLVVLLVDGKVLTGGLKKRPLCIYSSKTGTWSQPTCLAPPRPYPIDNRCPVALVGNTLYFRMHLSKILKYDLDTQEFSVILRPPEFHKFITMEDGGLGVAKLDEAATLSLWSMKANANGDFGWAQTRVIDLKKLLNVNASSIRSNHVGFALGVGVLLVGTDDGLFSFDLKSALVRNLCEGTCDVRSIELIVPHLSFYMPAVVSTGEGPSIGA